jgi:uncharacterized membrane protein
VAALDHLAAARRWVKFPATIMFATGLLWLLESYFQLDWDALGQQTETGIGAVGAFVDMVVIPLGSIAIGLGLMYLQRWALIGGAVLPLLPLLSLSVEKGVRVESKFAEFRASGEAGYFGDGVMTAITVLVLWALYIVILIYLYKAHKILGGAEQWLRRPQRDAATGVSGERSEGGDSDDDEGSGSYFHLFPEDTPGMEDEEEE